MPHESTRRSFVGAGAAALTSGVASARPAIESLAISGGPKAETVPADRQAEISKWPHYGVAAKRVILEVLDSNKSYGESPLLEKEMKDYLKEPSVKAHINATSALMSLFFATAF